jgi:hypothetical protein
MTRTAPKKANSRVTRIELPEKKMPRRLKSLTSPNTDLNGQVSPMERLTQPWKLCRSFGSQPVGSVVGPRWPEAGMAAQVIPSQSSRWTFRPGQSPTADLPTCRPGWRMTTGVATRPLSLGRSPGVSSILKHQRRGYRSEAILQTPPALPRPNNCPNVSSGITGSLNLLQFSISQWKPRGAPKYPLLSRD